MLAVAAIIVVLIVTSIRPAGPGPQNMASGGIQFTQGLEVTRTAGLADGADPIPNPAPSDPNVLQIQVYADYMCPYCNMFEQTNEEYIESLVDSGAATYEIFPVAILDRLSLGTKFSTRAANGAACVADLASGSFLDFHKLMFQNQPAENSSGLDDGQIVDLAAQAGADSAEVRDCITSKRYQGFVNAMTTAAVNTPELKSPQSGGFATPTVMVNGQRYNGAVDDADAFKAFILQVFGEATAGTETPTPTPTPTAAPTETPAP